VAIITVTNRLTYIPWGTRNDTEITDIHGAVFPPPKHNYDFHRSTEPGAVATGSFRHLPGRYRSRFWTTWQTKFVPKRERFSA